MWIELKARAAGGRRAQQASPWAVARLIIEPQDRPTGEPPRWIGSTIASIIGVAGAITALPELSAKLPPRAVLVLHFIATVGTSAQPLIVTIVAALVAAVEHRVRSRLSR